MENHNELITRFIIQTIIKSFENELKLKKLLELVPLFNAKTFQAISFEMTMTGQMLYQKPNPVGVQDFSANNIALDINANFRIECQQKEENITEASQQQHIQVARTKRSVNKQKSKEDSNETKATLFILSEPVLTQKQLKIDQQIEQVKKRFYNMQKLIKQNQEAVRLRLQENLNRIPLQIPGKQFAFDFSGELIPTQKITFKKHLVIQTGSKSQDVTQAIKKSTSFKQKTEENRDFLVSRGLNTTPSREGMRVLFANQGKRQVSHLPFIKLNDSTKILQGNKSANGPNSNRYTLKSYQSRADSNFKHYSEIEKERSDRLYSLKRSERTSQASIDDVQQLQIFTSPKKQSKRMQKYLRKLCQDRNKDFVHQINRSSNFDRLNSPLDYSVHRYYKHNFDDDKRSICQSSLVSLKINKSFFNETKTQ